MARLLPPFVIVEGVKYKVSRPTKVIFRGAEHDGMCDPANHSILVRRGLCPVNAWKRLLHEILHAIAYERGFDLSEQATEGLENGLYSVISVNGLRFGL